VHARLPAAITPNPAHENGRDVELSPLDAKVQRGKVVMGLKNVSFAWGVGGGGAEGNAVAEGSGSKRVGGGDVKGGGAEGPNAAVSSVRSGLGSVPILSGADLTVCEGDLVGELSAHRVSHECVSVERFFCAESASLRGWKIDQQRVVPGQEILKKREFQTQSVTAQFLVMPQSKTLNRRFEP
jgi:hypothetical protein